MRMISTAIKPETGEAEEMAPEFKPDPRPRLYLDDDIVEALGLAGVPTPGAVFNIQGRAVVARVTAEIEESGEAKREGKAPDVEMCLVFTDIGMEASSASDAQRATVLYGE